MFIFRAVHQDHKLSYTGSCLHWRESTNRTTFSSLFNLLSQEPKHYLTWPSIVVLSVICSVQGASQTEKSIAWLRFQPRAEHAVGSTPSSLRLFRAQYHKDCEAPRALERRFQDCSIISELILRLLLNSGLTQELDQAPCAFLSRVARYLHPL